MEYKYLLSSGTFSNFTDIYDLSWLLILYIARPLNFLEIYFATMGFFTSSPSFTPGTGISNLTGKVILVTGG